MGEAAAANLGVSARAWRVRVHAHARGDIQRGAPTPGGDAGAEVASVSRRFGASGKRRARVRSWARARARARAVVWVRVQV